MAVHPDHPGLTVEVVVDGEPLREYKDEAAKDGPNVLTRYVEAQPGAEFAIKYNFTKEFKVDKDITSRLRIDGKMVARRCFHNGRLIRASGHIFAGAKSEDQSKWVLRSFRFQELNIKDDEANTIYEDPKSLESLGSIRIEFKCGKKGKRLPGNASSYSLQERDSVPETAMKGEVKSLQTGVGTEHEVRKPTRKGWKTDSRLATFVFKYRTRANLQALWAIPRSPSPSEVVQVTPVTSWTSLPNIITPSVNLRSKTTSATPALPHQNSVRTTLDDYEYLTDEDVIALIKHYRGNDKGLAAQNRQHLLVLLKHYKDRDTESVPVKQEPVPSEPRVRIKCESTDDGAVREQGKKRKTEVIVLDD